MRLSDAIRLGSMLHPQCFGSMHSYLPGRVYEADAIIGSCALGAAEDAGWFLTLDQRTFTSHHIQCPACAIYHGRVKVVSHLNDDHRWTREAIADWVETVERRLENGGEVEARRREVSDPKVSAVVEIA